MIRILLTAIIFCSMFSFNAIAQPKPEVKAVVSPVELNVVYVGIDNPIHVAVPGYTCEQIIVTTNIGKIEGQGCAYVLRPESAGILKVYISVARNAEVALIDSFYFRSKRIPALQPFFGRYSIFDDTININQAKVEMGIYALIPMMDIQMRHKIHGYTMKVIRNCSLVYTGTSDSQKLTPEMEQIQSTFEKGDVLIFEQIKVSRVDGSVHITNPLRFILY